MQYVRSAFALLTLLSARGSYTWAQATESSIDVSPVGAAISVAPAVATSQSSASVKVRISVTNSTNRILVHTYPIQRGSVQIEVHDPAATIPPETDFGCKRHLSTKCGPSVKLGGPVSFTAMVVMPGKTISFERDLASEFDLNNAHSLVVKAIAMDFVLVDAPQSVTEAPEELRRGYLLDYERYNYTKLAPFLSKAITLQVGH